MTALHRLRYRVILSRSALAHWITPSGHDQGVFCDPAKSLASDLAAYGARLGVVEPCLHRAMRAVPIVAEVMDALRNAEQYELADKLRGARALLNDAGGYAFPGRYKRGT